MVLVELETMRHSKRSFIRRKTRTEDISSSGRGIAMARAGSWWLLGVWQPRSVIKCKVRGISGTCNSSLLLTL